jgi:hypothetical protein
VIVNSEDVVHVVRSENWTGRVNYLRHDHANLAHPRDKLALSCANLYLLNFGDHHFYIAFPNLSADA